MEQVVNEIISSSRMLTVQFVRDKKRIVQTVGATVTNNRSVWSASYSISCVAQRGLSTAVSEIREAEERRMADVEHIGSLELCKCGRVRKK